MGVCAVTTACSCWCKGAAAASGSRRGTESAPPEEAPRPRHLPQRQVELGGHEEVGHAQQAALRVQVRDRLVHRRVERRDHCGRQRAQRCQDLHAPAGNSMSAPALRRRGEQQQLCPSHRQWRPRLRCAMPSCKRSCAIGAEQQARCLHTSGKRRKTCGVSTHWRASRRR